MDGALLGRCIRYSIERKKNEIALREAKLAEQASKTLHKQVISMISDIVWRYDVNAKGENIGSYISPVADRMLDLPEGTIGDSFEKYYSYVHPDDLPALQKTLTEVIRNLETNRSAEYRLQKSDGTTFWVRSSGSAYRQPDGRVNAFGTTIDITERKKAEEDLRESEAKYRLLVENLNEGIWMIDENAVTTFVNPRMSEMLGYATEEMLGKHLFSFMDEQGVQIATKKLAIRQQGIGEQHDFEFMRKDGTRIYVRLETSPIIDIDGNYRGALAGVQDITENKRAERSLRETKDYLDKLISYANAPIIVWDPQRRITRFNTAFERLTGYYAEEVLGKGLSMLFPEVSRVASLQKIESSLRGEQWVSMEIPIVNNKTKEVRIALWNSANICSESGELQAVIAQGQDITELRHAADELQLANKKLQLLSSITRHDILNQINVLQIYLELAKEQSLDASNNEYLQKLETATKEILRHVEFTRLYEMPKVVKPIWQEVSGAIAKASSGRLPVRDECRGLFVYADPMLEKVFSNLMDNTIRHGERSTLVHTYYRNVGEFITIVWEDEGIGIPDDEKKLIFLKGFGKNTGFGLFLCKESLSITGIEIEETGTYGEGARFEITVPRGMWRTIGTDKG
jgi:PAS domain S-box-containing protein